MDTFQPCSTSQSGPERLGEEYVEWLAALWELTGEGAPFCENPHLLILLRLTPHLGAAIPMERLPGSDPKTNCWPATSAPERAL